MLKVYGYVRVSQTRGRAGESFVSPVEQAETIHQWAAANGAHVVEMFEELDESGGRKDRPKLLRVVDAIERGEVDGMVVARLDRYFRDQLGGHETMARIKTAKGFLTIPGDGIDTRNEAGKMLFGFLLTIAEGQLDRYRAQFADARKRAVARGIHPCPVPPFGYTRPTDPKGHVTGPLTAHPQTARFVTALYQRRAGGESLASLARWLEQQGARSAYDGTGWHGRAVKAIIRNRVYLGEARHGEFVHPGAHIALTDDVTWRRAQHPGTVPAARGTNPSQLAGILRCAGCRYGMRSWINRHAQREYGCHRRHAGGVCTAPASTSNPAIEVLVEEAFFAALGDVSARPAIDAGRTDEARAGLALAEADLAAYRDDPRILRAIGVERFAEGLELRAEAVTVAQRALDDCIPVIPAGLDVEVLRDRWPDLTAHERKRLLRLVIDCVFLRRGGRSIPITDRVHVCLRGSAPDLPRPGIRPSPVPVPFDW